MGIRSHSVCNGLIHDTMETNSLSKPNASSIYNGIGLMRESENKRELHSVQICIHRVLKLQGELHSECKY